MGSLSGRHCTVLCSASLLSDLWTKISDFDTMNQIRTRWNSFEPANGVTREKNASAQTDLISCPGFRWIAVTMANDVCTKFSSATTLSYTICNNFQLMSVRILLFYSLRLYVYKKLQLFGRPRRAASSASQRPRCLRIRTSCRNHRSHPQSIIWCSERTWAVGVSCF